MTTLATFRTAVLALLDDPTMARFTNAQVDVALTWALSQYSRFHPVMRTYSIDGAGTYRLVFPADFTATTILKVELDDGTDPPIHIPFLTGYLDENWYIQTTDRILSPSDSVLVTYDTPHTIDTLNSATGTTIPDKDDALVQLGAAGYAARMRAVSRAESINMQPEVRKQLQELAEAFISEFSGAIKSNLSIASITLPDPDDKF